MLLNNTMVNQRIHINVVEQYNGKPNAATVPPKLVTIYVINVPH